MAETATLFISALYGEDAENPNVAKLANLPKYLQTAKELAGEGNHVVLTGAGPVWLYLAVAHALHGKAMSLTYDSPASGPVEIFNHDPH